MRTVLRLVVGFLAIPLVPVASMAWESDQNIVGYYTSWSIYARDYHVPDIAAEKINVINYAFANIVDGQIALGDPYADIDRFYPGDSWDPDSLRGCFHQLQILKREHPHVRTLISVGGWTWSTYFSDVALTEESRALFAASCVAFIQQYGFDGVDIDWEYPVEGGLSGNIQRPEDKENFTLLLAGLRDQLDAAGDYLLTVAVTASPIYIENIETDLIHEYLDWINVMTYDFHGPWGGPPDVVTNFNSPLYVAPDDPLDEPYHSQFNLAAAIQNYLDRGVPSEKLQAGLAFYGRGYRDVADVNEGLFASYSGPSWEGTWEAGVFDFWDLAENYVDTNGYTRFRHTDAKVPWVYNPGDRVMISYDDAISIGEKGDFIVQRDLGGAMFWEFSADRGGVLLDAIYSAVHDTAAAGIVHDLYPSSASDITRIEIRPNPSSKRVAIHVRLDRSTRATIRIYDPAGRMVREVANRRMSSGAHVVIWDGTDRNGRRLASGSYVCRLSTSDRLSAVSVIRID